MANPTIQELVDRAWRHAEDAGFHAALPPGPLAIPVKLVLVHSEVSEALEADREGDLEGLAEELADIVIRVFDLCGYLKVDLEREILLKMDLNENRGHLHGGKRY